MRIHLIITLILSSSLLYSFPLFAANSMHDQVLSSIDTHRLSATYASWKSSGKTPHDIFETINAQADPDRAFVKLCEALKLQSPEDASIFLSETMNLPQKAITPCMQSFIDRVENFYSQRISILHQTYDLTFPLDKTRRTLSPTKTLKIDTTNGPRFITADLPHKTIAFTFDDGPHRKITPRLLKTLENQQIQVTFFVVGKNIKRYPKIISETLANKHTIGTHSWSHKQLPKLSHTKGVREISAGFEALLDSTGFAAPFFRFPYGARNNALKQYLKSSDIADFFWTIDTLDWKIKNPDRLFEYALEQIEQSGRGIVLFHDVQPQTISMFPSLLIALEQRGYRTVVFQPKAFIQDN